MHDDGASPRPVDATAGDASLVDAAPDAALDAAGAFDASPGGNVWIQVYQEFPGETGLPAASMPVQLNTADGALLSVLTTDDRGQVMFADVAPGSSVTAFVVERRAGNPRVGLTTVLDVQPGDRLTIGRPGPDPFESLGRMRLELPLGAGPRLRRPLRVPCGGGSSSASGSSSHLLDRRCLGRNPTTVAGILFELVDATREVVGVGTGVFPLTYDAGGRLDVRGAILSFDREVGTHRVRIEQIREEEDFHVIPYYELDGDPYEGVGETLSGPEELRLGGWVDAFDGASLTLHASGSDDRSAFLSVRPFGLEEDGGDVPSFGRDADLPEAPRGLIYTYDPPGVLWEPAETACRDNPDGADATFIAIEATTLLEGATLRSRWSVIAPPDVDPALTLPMLDGDARSAVWPTSLTVRSVQFRRVYDSVARWDSIRNAVDLYATDTFLLTEDRTRCIESAESERTR